MKARGLDQLKALQQQLQRERDAQAATAAAQAEAARRRTDADKPAFGFQGHPEAIPGPHDIGHLFDRFVALMEER